MLKKTRADIFKCFSFLSLGINLLFAVTHELGHSLGLAHTPDNEAVMAPFYKGYIPNLKLQPDDIRGIQYLYGVYKFIPLCSKDGVH